VHLAFAFVLCFLLYPARPGRSSARRPTVLDGVLAAAAVVALVYIIRHYDWIMENPSDSTRTGVILGTVLTVLTLEAAAHHRLHLHRAGVIASPTPIWGL
jgi:TRAP-type uncharacterized transport system fused permease subunit